MYNDMAILSESTAKKSYFIFQMLVIVVNLIYTAVAKHFHVSPQVKIAKNPSLVVLHCHIHNVLTKHKSR